MTEKMRNYINGTWQDPTTAEFIDVVNPATGEVLGNVPLSQSADVDKAVKAAAQAFSDWRRTPIEDRIQYLFK